ncbi:MAG: hypothetical protein QNJ06_15205 [Kiloniellales bacterium]|nr:hypothetical protein [Kiloniellales bacterium]MDJ0971239.1 hypothetical protein [Kiloniellales bacterium]MDJ0982362.1 hypothetical protein [Kiloniellales bacterium]
MARPPENPPPQLIVFLLRHLAVGAGAGILLGTLCLATDLSGLRTLLFGPGGGPLAIALFFFGLIVTFGSAAMGAAVMGLGRPKN